MVRKFFFIGMILAIFAGLVACAKTAKESRKPLAIPLPSSDTRYKKYRDGADEPEVAKHRSFSKDKLAVMASEARPTPKKNGLVSASVNRDLNIPQAGEHDDNEEIAYFLKFLNKMKVDSDLLQQIEGDRLITILDSNGNPVWNAELDLDAQKLLTAQDGETLIFEPVRSVSVRYGNFHTNVSLKKHDRRSEVVLPVNRELPAKLKADVVFIMDTTGSMGDEISMLRDTIYSIYMRLKDFNSGRIELRFGMVLYRDQDDDYVTRSVRLTSDIQAFQNKLFEVTADGGGDYPEDLVSGLQAADKLNWNKDAIKLAFVVTDAPAHISSFNRWTKLAVQALKRKLKIFTIGASGLDSEGEVQLRVLSQLTRGKFIFLTYGERGESEGSETKEDPGKVSHHTGGNYTSRSLDDIVVDNVRNELAYQLPPSEIAKIRKDYDYKGMQDKVERRVDNALAQLAKQLNDKEISKMSKPNVLFIPPDTKDDSLKTLSEHIVNVAQSLNQKENYFTWVDRQFTAEILKELKLQLAGFTDGDDLPELKSVDFILGGRLYFIGGNSVLFLKLVDVKHSTVLAATMIKI